MNNNTEKPDNKVKFQDPNKGQSVICKFYKEKLVPPAPNTNYGNTKNRKSNHAPDIHTHKPSTAKDNLKLLKSLEDKGKDLKS